MKAPLDLLNVFTHMFSSASEETSFLAYTTEMRYFRPIYLIFENYYGAIKYVFDKIF